MPNPDKIKAVIFNGSPRKGGNTELLINELARGMRDSGVEPEIFNLAKMNIHPCEDCGGCEQTGECIIHDDMDEIYEAIRTADRIALASPIFFFGISAQAKAMVDRTQAFWCEKYLLKKSMPEGPYGRKGLLVVVGGMKKEVGIECAGATAKAFFRTISVSEHKTLGYLGIDAKAEILKHADALKEVYEAGKSFVK